MLRSTKPWMLDALLAAVAVLVVCAPLFLTRSGFAPDFTNHLWLTWVQSRTLLQTGHPSYFVNTDSTLGVFYPFFAFYGGTLYVVTGIVSDLLGDQAVAAFVGVTILAVAASYAGTLWLGRQLGLRRWPAHAPALAVISSAYWITNLYGRGAWTELIATTAIPPMIAGGLYLIRAPHWRSGPILVFVGSVIAFTGSHNITLVWGPTMIALALAILWLAMGAPRRLPYRRLGMVAGLGLVATLVNGWFLFPDYYYAKDVLIHLEPAFNWDATGWLNTPGVLFYPLRKVPVQSNTPALFIQIPDWFLLWGLASGALLLWRPGQDRQLRRAWLAVATLIGVVLAMIMIEPFWELVPFPLDGLQFAYRLNTYVVYGIAGFVLVSAIGVQRALLSRSLRRTATSLQIGLVAVSLVSLGLSVWQGWVPEIGFPGTSYANRADALQSVNSVPASWYDTGSYRDVKAPVVAVPNGRTLNIDPARVHGDRFAAWMSLPPGSGPIQTNIGASTYMVHTSGIQEIGRDSIGYAVVRRTRDGSGPVHVVIEEAHNPVLDAGRAASIAAIVAVLLLLTYTSLRSLKARRSPSATTRSAELEEMASAPVG